jgi:uncharacterized membrane protein (Fun14 family)
MQRQTLRVQAGYMMRRLLRLLILLIILGIIGLVGYSYSGFLKPETSQISLPVVLDVD